MALRDQGSRLARWFAAAAVITLGVGIGCKDGGGGKRSGGDASGAGDSDSAGDAGDIP